MWLLATSLSEVESERRQAGIDVLPRKKLPKPHAKLRVDNNIFVGIDTNHQVVTLGEEFCGPFREELQPSLLRSHHLSSYLGMHESVRTLAEVADGLVLAIIIDVEVLPSQLTTIVLHPLPDNFISIPVKIRL